MGIFFLKNGGQNVTEIDLAFSADRAWLMAR